MAESFSHALRRIQDNIAAIGVLISLVALLMTVLGGVGVGAWRLATTLATLQTTVGTLETTVGTLSSNVAELDENVAGLSSDVAGLSSNVAELSSDVAGLRSNVAELDENVAELSSDVAGLRSAAPEQVATNTLTEFTQATRCLSELSFPSSESVVVAGSDTWVDLPNPPSSQRVMPDACKALLVGP